MNTLVNLKVFIINMMGLSGGAGSVWVLIQLIHFNDPFI
ncbi:putative membrane protein [Enterobacter hormaechei]|nr:putative membrane protein [Enterobacter hormaechei]